MELWAALPGPEKVNQSWPFEIDGVPVLVVRTQAADELNLFERQRLRVLDALRRPDAIRERSPTLAVELDSKRWHETAIALGDVDGDGHDDLLAAFPEGLSGTDLVVQWWRGRAAAGSSSGRIAATCRSPLPAGSWWRCRSPGCFLVGNDRMELRPVHAAGRAPSPSAPARRCRFRRCRVPGQAASKEARKVTVTVGGDGESSKVDNVDPDAEPLGAVELDGRPGAELLAVQGSGNGNERLILLRRRPD